MQVGVNDFMSMSLSKKQKFRKFFAFVATAISYDHDLETVSSISRKRNMKMKGNSSRKHPLVRRFVARI